MITETIEARIRPQKESPAYPHPGVSAMQRVIEGAHQTVQCLVQPREDLSFASYLLVFRFHFPAGAEVRVHHHTLPRLHRHITLPVTDHLGDAGLSLTTFTTPDNEKLPAGWQDMELHNAFVVFQPNGAAYLLAPLSEGKSRPGYSWSCPDPQTVEVSVEFNFPGLSGIDVAWGETFRGEQLFLQSWQGGFSFGPGIFRAYHDALEQAGCKGRVHAGPASRHEIFWGTWNEGIRQNISHDLILREARWLAREMPNVRWIQVDDGYERDGDKNPVLRADMSSHWREEDSWCSRRFPHGMRALADGIKELGLRPMIWFSPACISESDLFRTHPEYFIPDARLHFEANTVFPDYSVPAVRDIALRAIDRLFVDWGFEGVKLDFWTYGFTQMRLSLRQGPQSNLEWMQWLEKEIRARLPMDGLMLSCLEPANGNPFRSRVWDMYRIGPDIDGVTVPILEEIALWIALQVGLKETQRRFWIPNADGLSLFRHVQREDSYWRLATTLMTVTGSACELSGTWTDKESDERLRAFRRVIPRLRLGQTVLCPGYNWSENEGKAPELWVRQDDDGKRVIGLTNWKLQPARYALRELLGAELSMGNYQDAYTGVVGALPSELCISPGNAALYFSV